MKDPAAVAAGCAVSCLMLCAVQLLRVCFATGDTSRCCCEVSILPWCCCWDGALLVLMLGAASTFTCRGRRRRGEGAELNFKLSCIL